MSTEQKAQSMGQRYPHMCRDDHVQIGHSDSEHEICPLCRALNFLTFAVEAHDGDYGETNPVKFPRHWTVQAKKFLAEQGRPL